MMIVRLLSVFASQSKHNEICLGLFLSKFAPRDSFLRKRGFCIVDDAIADYFENIHPKDPWFIDGILGFLSDSDSAYIRVSEVVKSWIFVKNVLSNVSVKVH